MSSTASDTQPNLKEQHGIDDEKAGLKTQTQPCAGPNQVAPHLPSTSIWRRAILVALLAVLLWLAFYLRPVSIHRPKIIHASRYSKEFKYRPAASPVITEHLKDGRVRLRGAPPTN